MGGMTWSDDSYRSFSSKVASSHVDDIFKQNKSRSISDDMDPKNIKIRECRDSNVHPNTQGIVVALDVTGSMGMIPERMVRETLPNLMKTLIENNQPDAQVLFIAIGDHYSDSYPLQVGQFESGTDELIKWLTSTYLEGKGGGQIRESYSLAWLLASQYISMDCFEKRGQKGLLFTIGDEAFHEKLERDALKKIFGSNQELDLNSVDLLRSAERMFDVFHLHCVNGSYGKKSDIVQPWAKILGERLIFVEDTNKIPEIIASTVAIFNQIGLDTVTQSFDDSTALVVRNAVGHLVPKSESGISKEAVGAGTL